MDFCWNGFASASGKSFALSDGEEQQQKGGGGGGGGDRGRHFGPQLK